MRPVHYITIVIGVALVAILYFGGNTVAPQKEGTAPVASAGHDDSHAVTPVSFDSIVGAARVQLPAHAAEEIKTIENKLTAISDSSHMAVVFDTLAKVWQEHKQMPVAAYYHLLAGKLENSEKKLTFAAQLFLELAKKSVSESEQAWLGQMAIEGFSKTLEINPKNESAKVNLAECYIGTGETMKGVLMLREVAETNPKNVSANLVLGQQGIISGQLDKAQARFEKVLEVEPKSVEAMLGLAEVHKGKGDKAKAIELLERSKKVMNNPDFSRDIDQYINSFK